MPEYFLILSLRRCGSTYLASLLNNCASVFCEKELVFRDSGSLKSNHVRFTQADNFRDVINSIAGNPDIRGSKLTVPDYQSAEVNKFTSMLQDNPVKLVHLTRNMCQQFVSLMTVKKTDVWHVVDKNEKANNTWMKNDQQYLTARDEVKSSDFQFFVEPGEAEKFCRDVTVIDSAFSTLARNGAYIRIDYDDLRDGINRIFDFLNVPSDEQKTSSSSYRKIVSEPHYKYIENWDQVAEIFEAWEKKRQSILENCSL